MRTHRTYSRFMHNMELLEAPNRFSLETRLYANLTIHRFKVMHNFNASPFLWECFGFYVSENFSRCSCHDVFQDSRTDVLAQQDIKREMVVMSEISELVI